MLSVVRGVVGTEILLVHHRRHGVRQAASLNVVGGSARRFSCSTFAKTVWLPGFLYGGTYSSSCSCSFSTFLVWWCVWAGSRSSCVTLVSLLRSIKAMSCWRSFGMILKLITLLLSRFNFFLWTSVFALFNFYFLFGCWAKVEKGKVKEGKKRKK